MRIRKGAARSARLAVALVAAAVVFPFVARASSPSPSSPSSSSGSTRVEGGVGAPAAGTVTPGCQLLDPAQELGPAASLPSRPLSSAVAPPGGVYSMAVAASGIYVVNGNGVYVYSLSGGQTAHFSLPTTITRNLYTDSAVGPDGLSQPIVDPSGDVYLASHYGGYLVELSPGGRVLWSIKGASLPTNAFAVRAADGGFAVALSTVGSSSSTVYEAGRVAGTVPLSASGAGYLSTEAGGDILYADGNGMVQTWTPGATAMISEFGSPGTGGSGQYTGGPYSFYYPGQAVAGPDGDVYTADGLSDLTVTSAAGDLLGATTLNGAFSNSDGVTGELGAAGSDLYVAVGPPFDPSADVIDVLAVATVQSFIAAPQASLDSLGWGAGLHSTATAGYFAPGSSVGIYASFAPWWSAQSSHLRLSYSVWDDAAWSAGTQPAATTVALGTSPAALARVALTIPAADTTPGPYAVQARLLDTSSSPARVIGATCMPYTVGAPGDGLDLATLPPGSGEGGPTEARGVALNAQLGLDGYRAQTLDWSVFLPGCRPSAPTTATCGPAAMSFAHAPQSYFQGAYLAHQDGIAYWIMTSSGVDGISMALVDGGWWEQDLAELVSYYSHPPSSCTDCAAVTAWEPWNEADNTGWSNPAQYLTKVLEPFRQAIKAVNPSYTVVGGSSVGLDPSWWRGFVAAGGLPYLDVVAVHPYPGDNDSWDEDGETNQVAQLRSIVGSKPLWFTEIGWWSDTDYDYLAQADQVAQALVWEAAWHVPVTNYYYDEGGESTDGLHFTLIQTADGADDFVKPSALATMTASRELHGRSLSAMVATGVPGLYDAAFAGGGSTPTLDALWTDGETQTLRLTATSPTGAAVPLTVTSQYGATRTGQLASGTAYRLGVDDEVTWLSYPAGDTVTVGAVEPYGTSLTSASGVTASASSGPDAAAVLSDPAKADGYGLGWTASPTDEDPTVTVTLPAARPVDRVVVDTQSMGGTSPGVRAFTLSVETSGGSWENVATVSGQFRDHAVQVDTGPVVAEAVRVTVDEVNYGGYYGGGIPPFWPANSPDPAFLHAVEVYSGQATAAQLDGADLPALP